MIADSLTECITKLTTCDWRDAMEGKGLRFNMKKTMFMISVLDFLHDFGAFLGLSERVVFN